jgi:hypothetical protein
MDVYISDKVVECKDTTKADLEDLERSPALPILISILRQAATSNSFFVREKVRDGKYDEARFEEGFTEALEGLADYLEHGIEQSLGQK